MGAIAGMSSFFPVQLQKVHSPINGKRIRIGLFIAGMGSFGCTVLIHKSAQTLEKYM